ICPLGTPLRLLAEQELRRRRLRPVQIANALRHAILQQPQDLVATAARALAPASDPLRRVLVLDLLEELYQDSLSRFLARLLLKEVDFEQAHRFVVQALGTLPRGPGGQVDFLRWLYQQVLLTLRRNGQAIPNAWPAPPPWQALLEPDERLFLDCCLRLSLQE